LRAPHFLLEASERLSAADVGSATHLVLQHLDWSRACSGDDLAEQINSMIGRKLLAPVQARVVDLDAIEWFANSDLGRWICGHPRELIRREVPFNFAVDPSEIAPGLTAADPNDQLMVRGRIDLLAVQPEGLTIIDYKTDRLAPERLSERADFYRPQVELYKRALASITARPVKDVFLVFLHARQTVRL
jgi:ATP-dependent helicase/nuclease subunit A